MLIIVIYNLVKSKYKKYDNIAVYNKCIISLQTLYNYTLIT